MQISAIPDPIEEAELVEQEASSADAISQSIYGDDETGSLGRMREAEEDDDTEDATAEDTEGQ